MNLLDRHIFKSVLGTSLAAVGLFAFVLALGNIVRELLGPLLAGQLSPMMMLRLVLLLLPFAIMYALPMGILTGVLLTLGRLSADSEVTAMRAAGIGIMRIARPVFILGGIGTLVALHVNFESMPWARVQYHREFADAMRTNPMSFIVPKTFIRDFKGFVVYIGDRPAQSLVLRDVWVWQLDNESRAKLQVHAESGRIDFEEAQQTFVLTLFRAVLEERATENPEAVFAKAPRVQTMREIDQWRVRLEGNLGHNIYRVKPEWLRWREFRERMRQVAAEPVKPGEEEEARMARMKLAMIVHDKINLSLAVFAFAFVAVPLGIKVSRRETSANLGVAVLLVLGYYFLITMVKWLDRHPEYRPDLLLWLPNLVFLGFGAWLIKRVQGK